MALVREDRDFFTDQEVKEMNESERGKLMRWCIEHDDFTWYTALYTRLVNKWLEKRSMVRRVLRSCQPMDTNVPVLYRDGAAIAYTLERRQPLCEGVMEAEQNIRCCITERRWTIC